MGTGIISSRPPPPSPWAQEEAVIENGWKYLFMITIFLFWCHGEKRYWSLTLRWLLAVVLITSGSLGSVTCIYKQWWPLVVLFYWILLWCSCRQRLYDHISGGAHSSNTPLMQRCQLGIFANSLVTSHQIPAWQHDLSKWTSNKSGDSPVSTCVSVRVRMWRGVGG